MKTYFTERKL